jgi:hypothetical protein
MYEVEIRRDDGTAVLKDSEGNIIDDTLHLPLKTPDDVLDAVLDDIGVVEPVKTAFKTLLNEDWEIVEVSENG